jgi:hypothetical protein
MKAGSHSMPEACPEASATIQLVQIAVSPTLDWLHFIGHLDTRKTSQLVRSIQ